MKVFWFELKLLDKSTNHTSRTEMIKQLLDLGMEVKYFCGYKSLKKYYGLKSGVINYISTPRIPKIRGLFLRAGVFSGILKSIVSEKPDIIMIDYLINLMIFPLWIIRKICNKKTKLIMDIRTIPVKKKGFYWHHVLFLISLRIAKYSCDGITFIAPFMCEYYSRKLKLCNVKTSIWTSGFNGDLFDTTKYQKNRTNLTFELFYHGGISLSRGIGALIKSVKILKDKNFPVSLTLIGNVVDKQPIENMIRENHLEDRCEIHPPVPYDQIPQMIVNCDLPVIPFPDFLGWRVSSPIKLMEYMALGKSLVLTDIEAHRNVVGDNEFAFYADSSQPEDLAVAIERAYASRDNLEVFGNKAKELAWEKYTWKSQAVNLKDFLQTI